MTSADFIRRCRAVASISRQLRGPGALNRKPACRRLAVILCVAIGAAAPVMSQESRRSVDSEVTQRHAERFLALLKRRPSFGTALERVSRYHIQNGTMDQLLQKLLNSPADSDSSASRLIAGMLQIQRGHGADVVSLLQDVEQQRADDPVASQALGLAARAGGDLPLAIAAFERAISRRPAKSALRTIYSDLARLHQQASHPQRALDVWRQLEAAFPRDRAIQEDVAARLQEDGQLQPALERWQRLSAETTNPERRTRYQLSVADIQLRQGHAEDALQTLEAELSRIRPGSWLDQLIRTRVESALLSSGGRSAVIDYYRDRVADFSDDTGACRRLADLLAGEGQFDEAAELYRKAIDHQPSSVELRTAYVNLLSSQEKFTEAVTASRELIRLNNAGTDELELTGRLLLRDTSLEPATREQQASDVWMKICDDSQDAAKFGYTARLHRRFGLGERAVDLYQSTIELDPQNSVWREELGQTLYELGRREEALQAWSFIADGTRRSTETLSLLSEILEKAGESAAALTAMQEACELQPTISDRIRLARLLRRGGRTDDCYAQLALATAECSSVSDRRVVADARMEAWKQDPDLFSRIAGLEEQLRRDPEDAEGWLQLAGMYHTERRFAEAVRCVEQATTLATQSELAWQAAAEIFFQAGLLNRAASAARTLAEVSPRQRITALQQVVRLEQQLGRLEPALEAAETLVRESPGHADSCRQFADLCFQSGRDADGLQALRQCLERNPDDIRLSIEIAEILADQFQAEEALSVLWRAFDRAGQQEQRLTLIESLVELSRRNSSVDRVFERLSAASGLSPVDRAICVAAAIQQNGDPARALESLETASQHLGRDVRVLRMLVELAEATGELSLAAQYQQQVTAVSASTEEHIRLATLQFQTGQLSETELSWIRDARSGTDTQAALRSIDRFLDGGRIEAAELMSQRLTADRPADWRVLYRLAMIQWRLDRRQTAVSTLQRILELDLPTNHRFGASESSETTAARRVLCPLARQLNQIVDSLNWLQLYTGNELWSETLRSPDDYGAARCAAVGFVWLAADSSARRELLDDVVGSVEEGEFGIADWCAMVFVSRWVDAEADVRPEELLEQLNVSDDIERQLVLAGLLCDGGVFRRPARTADRVVQTKADARLITAAETVAVARPQWMADIGGWDAVYRRLQRSETVADIHVVIARLLESPDPAVLISATDLAFATSDADSIARCLQESIKRRDESAVLRASLLTRTTELATLAVSLTSDDSALIPQLVDAILQLQAVRYVPVTSADAAADQVYRLESLTTAGRTTPGVEPEDDQGSADPNRSRGHDASHLRPHLDPALMRLLIPTANREHWQRAEQVRHCVESVADDRSRRTWLPASIALVRSDEATGQPAAAMLKLVDVVRALPEDVDVHLLLAELLHDAGANREALQVLERLPMQHRRETILEIERLALTLSAAVADQEHARLAASRLFELQLNPKDVKTVATQLEIAGLPEMAQRFRSRLSGSAVGGAEQLGQVMLHYFEAGNTAAAVRIARQFVLQPSIVLDGTSVIVTVRLRRNAIRILAEADAIRPMIRQLQQRLKDNTATFHQQHLLVELLRAGGQEADAEQVAGPLRESLVQDPTTGLQLARQLERQGRLESACDVCRYLLEADTSLFHRDYYRFIRLFEKNGRLEELADLVMTDDLRQQSGSHWGVQQLTERLLPKNQSLGLELFQEAWHAWPASHSALLANVADDVVWQLPEVLAYGRAGILPTEDRAVQPWDGIAEQFHVGGRGLVSGRMSRLLPDSLDKEDAQTFAADVQKALTMQPGWLAGQVYAALLQARTTPNETMIAAFDAFLDQHLAAMPPNVVWVTACELQRLDDAALTSLVIRLLESLGQRRQAGVVLLGSDSSWDDSPDYLLLQQYAATGEKAAAAEVMDRLVDRITSPGRSAQPAKSQDDAFDDLEESLRHWPDLSGRIKELRLATDDETSNDADQPAERISPQTEVAIEAVRQLFLTP